MFETHNLERVSLVASDKKYSLLQEESRAQLAPTTLVASKTRSYKKNREHSSLLQEESRAQLAPTGRDYKRMSNAISCQ